MRVLAAQRPFMIVLSRALYSLLVSGAGGHDRLLARALNLSSTLCFLRNLFRVFLSVGMLEAQFVCRWHPERRLAATESHLVGELNPKHPMVRFRAKVERQVSSCYDGDAQGPPDPVNCLIAFVALCSHGASCSVFSHDKLPHPQFCEKNTNLVAVNGVIDVSHHQDLVTFVLPVTDLALSGDRPERLDGGMLTVLCQRNMSDAGHRRR